MRTIVHAHYLVWWKHAFSDRRKAHGDEQWWRFACSGRLYFILTTYYYLHVVSVAASFGGAREKVLTTVLCSF